MKKTLNIILFGRKKSYFVKCTLTLIGLYLGVLFWYFNVDYLGQPIQNALVLAVCSLICISVLIHRMSILYVLFLPFYAIFRHYKYTNSNIKLIIVVSTLTIIGYYLALQVQHYAIAFSLLDGADLYLMQPSL